MLNLHDPLLEKVIAVFAGERQGDVSRVALTLKSLTDVYCQPFSEEPFTINVKADAALNHQP